MSRGIRRADAGGGELVGLRDAAPAVQRPSRARSRGARSGSAASHALCHSDRTRPTRRSFMTPARLRELVMEPRPRRVPVVDDGAHRDTERLRRLLDGEPTEEPQLDDLARSSDRSAASASRASFESHDVDVGVRRGDLHVVERHARRRLRPRLTACRARAASTSTRRIICAVVAKKCARFCQCTVRQSSRRTYDSCTQVGRLPPGGHSLAQQSSRRAISRSSRWTSGAS